jgi:hypothetical protein
MAGIGWRDGAQLRIVALDKVLNVGAVEVVFMKGDRHGVAS